MNTDVVNLPQKRKCSPTSLLISHERNYTCVGRCHRLISYPMQLLLNISRDYNLEHREQDENKKNQILKHKSVENLHAEIFHDNITFNQSLLRNMVQIE